MQIAGRAVPSFTSLHLQPPVSEDTEDMVLWTAGALYAGAADTVRLSFIKLKLYLLTHITLYRPPLQ